MLVDSTVYTKFAGHAGQVRRNPKMSDEGLLLNSIKCLTKRSKCLAKLKKSSCTLILQSSLGELEEFIFQASVIHGLNTNINASDMLL